MKRKNILYLAVLVCATTALLASGGRSATEVYATEPLSDPIRDVAENTVEFTQFNNWLNTNYDAVPEDRRQALKEHLYSIIDSHVKQLYEREGALLPVGEDIILPMSFAWATRMGVFGAHSVLAELDPDAAKTVTTPVAAPESLKINARGDMLVISSNWGGWTAAFPYWFMVNDLRQFRAGNGLQTQLAAISTGFGHHTADDGYSQATIMIVYSPEGSELEFREFWLQLFKLTAADEVEHKNRDMRIFRKLDAPTHMHTEVVFPDIAKGAMAVSYMGLAGTYEHNHQHFEDFLAALSLPPGD